MFKSFGSLPFAVARILGLAGLAEVIEQATDPAGSGGVLVHLPRVPSLGRVWIGSQQRKELIALGPFGFLHCRDYGSGGHCWCSQKLAAEAIEVRKRLATISARQAEIQMEAGAHPWVRFDSGSH